MKRPVSADAAAVSGDTRYTLALLVPERPSKLRLLVLSETASVAGDMCAPMQKPQAFSRMRQPAFTRMPSEPSAASMFTTCLEPHAMPTSTSSATWRPLSIWATVRMSRYDEFVHEPIIIWFTLVPRMDFTPTTLPGECGAAAMGSTFERSISKTSS